MCVRVCVFFYQYAAADPGFVKEKIVWILLMQIGNASGIRGGGVWLYTSPGKFKGMSNFLLFCALFTTI